MSSVGTSSGSEPNDNAPQSKSSAANSLVFVRQYDPSLPRAASSKVVRSHAGRVGRMQGKKKRPALSSQSRPVTLLPRGERKSPECPVVRLDSPKSGSIPDGPFISTGQNSFQGRNDQRFDEVKIPYLLQGNSGLYVTETLSA